MGRSFKKYTLFIASLFSLICILPFQGRAAFSADSNAGTRKEGRDVIVIDPGHGGEDSGALGPGGIEEKKITLSVAKKLAEILAERLGCVVLLTRTDDTFVPLRERTAFANRSDADIFISIHANAAHSTTASGVETFFLSYEATDDEAKRLAAIENSSVSDAYGPGELSDDVQAILFDLEQSLSHHESSALAESLQSSMVSVLGMEDRGVKQAPFVVLAGAAMPAVLVEVGFISNRADENRLAASKNQLKIADSIARGVMNFKTKTAKGADYAGSGQAAQKGSEQGF